MKKLMAVLLSLGLLLGATGCTSTKLQRFETEKRGAYSQVWAAMDDDVTHDVGGMCVDDGWGAVLTESSGALCRVNTQKLYKTTYTAAASLLINENPQPKNRADAIAVAVVLRVIDGQGKELGRRNVHVGEFDRALSYKDFVFTFSVDEPTDAQLEIYWPGTNYVRVGEFGIKSDKADALPNFFETGAALLGLHIQEDTDIEYSDDSLYYFDLYDYMLNVAADSEQQYDIANLVCTLQGLVNRDGNHLFVDFVHSSEISGFRDTYWLDYLRENGRLLADKTLVTVKSPATLLRLFSDSYKGFAAWDGTVPATVNAVATACGVDDLLPVRYSSVSNSLFWFVQHHELFADKPVKVNLGRVFTGQGKIYQTDLNSTGSRKNDAYLWAKAQYLDTQKVNSHMMAYHVDAYANDTVFATYTDLQNMFLSNRDYYIQNKCFFFDVSPMRFEIPDDDPDQAGIDVDAYANEVDGLGQTIDYGTFTAVMRAQAKYAERVDAEEPIDVGGFTPWHLKYTRYTNPDASGEVTCEWETVYQFSIYNAYINADAPGLTAMANASIYSHVPMKEQYKQKGKAAQQVTETLPAANEKSVNYLMVYMGDFDASAWLNMAMPKLWNDPNRGKLPLAWNFALNISKRAPHVVDWMYETATENDYFVAGDNGIGYLNPEAYANNLSQDVYGDLDSWAAANKKVYERFAIDYTGFLITRGAASDAIMECYKKFCRGVATNYAYDGSVNLPNVICVGEMKPETFAGYTSAVGQPCTFTQVRFILKTPTDVLAAWETLKKTYPEKNFKLVDPYTFYTLKAQQDAQ